MSDDPRRALKALIAADPRHSLTALSRLIGRNAAYLQQFVERGTPRALAERDRQRLARYLGVSEALLGGDPAMVRASVARLDVDASAGPGRVNANERAIGAVEVPEPILRALGVRAASAALIRAQGWSMEPGITDGDELLVDRADTRVTRTPGVFVILVDGATLVKRVSRDGGRLTATSDHPDAPPVVGEMIVIGRVVGLARALR